MPRTRNGNGKPPAKKSAAKTKKPLAKNSAAKTKKRVADVDPNDGMLTKLSNATASGKWKSSTPKKTKEQTTLFGSGMMEIKKEAAMIGQEVLMDPSVWDNVPKGMEDTLFKYKIDSYSESRKEFSLKYLALSIKPNGKEWISLPDESKDGQDKIMENDCRDALVFVNQGKR